MLHRKNVDPLMPDSLCSIGLQQQIMTQTVELLRQPIASYRL